MDNDVIKKRLIELMNINENDFISISDIKKKYLISEFKLSGLNKNSKDEDFVKLLNLNHISGIELIYKGKNIYVCKHNSSQMILNQLIRMKNTNPPTLLSLLKKLKPLKKKDYISTINLLIDKQLIKVSFKNDFSINSPTVYLHLLQEKKQSLNMDEDIHLFKKGYDFIGKGRGFVRIHRIREYLKWDRDRFDNVLKKLINDFIIELHGGDPSIMTKAEIDDSYVDPKTGLLFITVSWWSK